MPILTITITIITINYNNLEGLKRTVDSVVNQTWQEFSTSLLMKFTHQFSVVANSYDVATIELEVQSHSSRGLKFLKIVKTSNF